MQGIDFQIINLNNFSLEPQTLKVILKRGRQKHQHVCRQADVCQGQTESGSYKKVPTHQISLDVDSLPMGRAGGVGRVESIPAFKMKLDKLTEELHFMVFGIIRGQTP